MAAQQWRNAPEMAIDASKNYRVTIETNKGNIELELYPQYAPQTVNNFVFLAQNGFYDGITFHRVISNFMVQGDGLGRRRAATGDAWRHAAGGYPRLPIRYGERNWRLAYGRGAFTEHGYGCGGGDAANRAYLGSYPLYRDFLPRIAEQEAFASGGSCASAKKALCHRYERRELVRAYALHPLARARPVYLVK